MFSNSTPPTKAEQEAIAGALSDADELIASLEQLIEKKRMIKQGAMQELLTGKKRLPGFNKSPATNKPKSEKSQRIGRLRTKAEINGPIFGSNGILHKIWVQNQDLKKCNLSKPSIGKFFIHEETFYSA